MSTYMIEIWGGRDKPEKSYEFTGTRAEARTEARKHYLKGNRWKVGKSKPRGEITPGSGQIAHERWVW